MNTIRYAVLTGLLLLTLVMMAAAQQETCEYNGKTFNHREQVWMTENGGQCHVCWHGKWSPIAQSQTYCKGKY